MDIDPITGLPKELGLDLSKDNQEIAVSIVKKKFGKKYTVLVGFDRETDVKHLAKQLKNRFACGGTFKDEQIELQGDHKAKVKGALVELGFKGYNIQL